MTEPVTAHTQRFVRCLWTLDRDLAYARHYPAVVLVRLVLPRRRRRRRLARRHGDPGWARAPGPAGRRCSPRPTGSASLAELVGVSALPGHERVVLLAGRLLREGVLQQSALSAERRLLRRGARPAALVDAVLAVVDALPGAGRRGRARRRDRGAGLLAGAAGPGGRRRRRRRGRRARGAACSAAGDGLRGARRARTGAHDRLGAASSTPTSRELRGPLLVVRGVRGVGWDEFAAIRAGDGRAAARAGPRGRPATSPWCRCSRAPTGIDPAATRSRSPAARCGSRSATGWLGRVCNGRGEPLDGGPPVTGDATAAGRRLPAEPDAPRAARRAGAHRHLGDRRADHPGPRPEAADLLGRRAAAPRAGRADRRAGDRRAASRSAWCSPAMGLTHADAAAVRDVLEERSAAGELVLLLNTADDPVIERILTPRIALTVAEHLAFDARPARAGGDGRHDQLLRGAARGLRGPRRDPGPPGLPRLPLQRPRLPVRAVRPDPRARRAR